VVSTTATRVLVIVTTAFPLLVDLSFEDVDSDATRLRGEQAFALPVTGNRARHNRGMVARAVTVVLALWAALEVGLRVAELVRRQGGTSSDRGTRVLIALSLGASIAGGVWLTAVTDDSTVWRLPSAAAGVGVAVMLGGLGVRIWAVLTLGRSFRTTVEVHPDQRVVDTGPYRFVRHPSYTGLLMVVLGFEIGTRTWPAILLTLLPLAAVVRRIAVEEAFLLAALGPPYAAYRERTRRLLPGVW